MPETSPTLAMPYIQPAQAQKHVTHNEALRILDAVSQLSVLNADLAEPPLLPEEGDRYIVAQDGTGAWAGQDFNVAIWVDWGRLFLCGDAAHIVPPTGAKGLNTAASDVHYLYTGLREYYENGSTQGIDTYSENALKRVWKAERFSWWFSSLMHRYPDQSEFDLKMQVAELEFLRSNKAARQAMAENYVGLPY